MSLNESVLTKLRWAFVALGAGLLLAIGLLLNLALSRLDDQRALRHRMVAERVFDEVEREISSLLQHEAERPSAAYEPLDTDPARWSTFVLGYYRRDPQMQVIAEAKLAPERRARVRGAVAQVLTHLNAKQRESAHQDVEAQAHEGLAAQPSSPDVLRQLNRGVKVREARQRLTRTLAVVAADADTLVVERASPDADRREGFVLDVSELVSTIQSWVLSAQGLDAVASLSTARPSVQRHGDGYDFSHQLATPLASQHVFLHVSRLDDQDASDALLWMTALLAAAAVLGLFALYRMAAVQIVFAERRNNFVAAVTHELRTPLTAIRMYGEMLRDGMIEDEGTRREYYATITAEGERLTRLINNVMEHAQLRRGERQMHVVRADVGPIVHDVIELMRPHIASQGFTVEVNVAASLPEAHVDVDAFKQVLFNVLDNALKYGRAGEAGTVEVTVARVDDGVQVSVRDYGPGVGSHHLATIFEPFFRGEDELTRRQKGTGIGLALVRDLVERMHGRVQGINRSPGLEICIGLSTAR